MFTEREKPNARLVADFDTIVESPGRVRLHGKDHEIKPVLVEEFFALSNAWAKIMNVKVTDKVTFDEMVNAYYDVIFPVCPSITREDLKKCQASQLAGLVQFVMNHVTGGLTEEKKKKLQAGILAN